MLLWASLNLDWLFSIHRDRNWSQLSGGSHMSTQRGVTQPLYYCSHCFICALKGFIWLLQPHLCTRSLHLADIYQDIKSSLQWLRLACSSCSSRTASAEERCILFVCAWSKAQSELYQWSVSPIIHCLLNFCKLSQSWFFFFSSRSLIKKKQNHLRPRTNHWRPPLKKSYLMQIPHLRFQAEFCHLPSFQWL